MIESALTYSARLAAGSDKIVGPEKTKTKSILLIEDDLEMREVIKNCLRMRYRCKLDVASDPYEAMNKMTEHFYDLLVLDWKLPPLTGGEMLRATEKELYFEPDLPIQWDKQKVPVVIFSSSEKAQCSFHKSKHFNCVGFVSKKQPLKNIIDAFQPFLEPVVDKVSEN